MSQQRGSSMRTWDPGSFASSSPQIGLYQVFSRVLNNESQQSSPRFVTLVSCSFCLRTTSQTIAGDCLLFNVGTQADEEDQVDEAEAGSFGFTASCVSKASNEGSRQPSPHLASLVSCPFCLTYNLKQIKQKHGFSPRTRDPGVLPIIISTDLAVSGVSRVVTNELWRSKPHRTCPIATSFTQSTGCRPVTSNSGKHGPESFPSAVPPIYLRHESTRHHTMKSGSLVFTAHLNSVVQTMRVHLTYLMSSSS